MESISEIKNQLEELTQRRAALLIRPFPVGVVKRGEYVIMLVNFVDVVEIRWERMASEEEVDIAILYRNGTKTNETIPESAYHLLVREFLAFQGKMYDCT